MNDLKDKWPVAPLTDAARERMVARAVEQTQLLPWRRMVTEAVERALSDWRYGLGVKMAAAAACALLGLGIGMNLDRPASDVTRLAFAHSGVDANLEAAQ